MLGQIPIIDIFAGPGGLGEGFSSALSENGNNLFRIKLSIEKDRFAHQTLELRAFFRQFKKSLVPNEYYKYLKGVISREDLFTKYLIEATKAKNEAWEATLGETPNEIIDSRIIDSLQGNTSWVLIGGPPCQAYSLIGRSKMKGEDKKKKKADRTFEKDDRHFLYREYLRILAMHKPAVFVMENVKGLLSAEIKNQNIFNQILRDLQNPLVAVSGDSINHLSYSLFSVSKRSSKIIGKTNPKDFIVRSEDYGIPQARHRIIILGVRSDIYKRNPDLLKRRKKISIEKIIGQLPKLRSGLSKQTDSSKSWYQAVQRILKTKWLKSTPLIIRKQIKKELPKVKDSLTRGTLFVPSTNPPKKYKEWFLDEHLEGICNHESRGHIEGDLHRYFFASVFAKVYNRSPNLKDFPKDLLPNHKNASDGTKFTDRFRVQIRGKPASTIVSHISQDGHYYIHYDSAQCRSLTVREAARLQTFPDNYFFEGSRTQQYHQVGNAVPPMLAFQIAHIVAKILIDSDNQS
jgi:DNA (cytosine-5)-methyltransferase 1